MMTSVLGYRFALLILFTACTSSLVSAQYDGALPVNPELEIGFNSISPDQSKEWLSLLAGPVFEGRGTGQLGYVRAAHWVAGKTAEFGLMPMGDGGTYFQMLPMTRLLIDESQSYLTGPTNLSIPFAKNIGLDRYFAKPELTGKIVFVTLTGDNPQIDENLIRDKIVVFTVDAKNERRASLVISAKRPAASLRVVNQEVRSTPQLQRRNRAPTAFSGTISQNAAVVLANAVGGNAEWVTIGEKSTTQVHATESEVKFQYRIREEPIAVPNVLAWLPGSDAQLNQEYVVIGAHLDHLGMQGGATYPGADDNGSGSTAILNIAKAMSTNPTKPKRSVLFIWFAAEEMGLVGSSHYCDNPILPLDKMVCMLNIDMVGRNEEKANESAAENENTLHLVGSEKGDKSLHEVILDANKHVNLVFEFDEEGVFGRSDQANFFRKGVSVAFLFGGFHPDYHRPTDSPDKINYKKLASAAKLFYLTAHMAAEHGQFKIPAAKPDGAPAAK